VIGPGFSALDGVGAGTIEISGRDLLIVLAAGGSCG
jgi:hypothetical protein